MKRQRYDFNTPGTRELIDEIVHGTFVKEGTLVAFPTCFPGASVPIRADESRITALDATADGSIYGGTSGWAVHLFVGMFHGVTGAVLDLGTVAGATQCPAVCCGQTYFVAAVNGEQGGRLVGRKLQPLPFDLIQEWGFSRWPFDELGAIDGERLVHLAAAPSRRQAVGVSERHLFAVDLEEKKVEVVAELEGRGPVAVDAEGCFLGLDGEGHLWRYEPQTRRLARQAVPLPPGAWSGTTLCWARHPVEGTLYAADGQGRIFSYRPDSGWSPCLGQTPVAPVRPMAMTFDGRLFGFCGEGIARLFTCDPDGGVRDLGVAASVLQRRRYGYAFGAAVVGRDGELVFGEDDDLGHLWLYFPKIASR